MILYRQIMDENNADLAMQGYSLEEQAGGGLVGIQERGE